MITLYPRRTSEHERPRAFTITVDGDVAHQDFWRGNPTRLVGFQDTLTEQRVTLRREDWELCPRDAIGRFPVFVRRDGTMFCLKVPIGRLTGTTLNGADQ